MWLRERIEEVISELQQSQEGDTLTEFAILFLLSSIILVSTMNILLRFIEA